MDVIEFIKEEANISDRNSISDSIKEIEELYKKFVSSMKDDNKEIIDEFGEFDFKNLMISIENSNTNVNNIPYDSMTKFIFSTDTPFTKNSNKIEVMPNTFTTFFEGAFENFLKTNYKKSKITAYDNQISENENQIKNLMKIGKITTDSFKKEYDIEKIKEDIKTIKVVYKIIDHLNLAIEQKTGLYDKQKVEIKEMSSKIEQLNKDINNENKKMKEIQDTYINIEDSRGKIYTEFVAILGIFASIIFGVFGGFQEIQLIGKNLNSTPIPKLLIFSSLVMLGVTLIIFLCFNAVSKLTKLPLKSCNCEIGKCDCSYRKKTSYYILFYLFVHVHFMYRLCIKIIQIYRFYNYRYV
ncbi:hypothetical protein K4Q10_06090 [Staphylococcus epidermidis]|nr:hypothetical protein [Staphylococcus epidermidis]